MAGGLDPQRVVQVLASNKMGAERFGSGYQVTGGLVLTAEHVVRDCVTVRLRFVEGPDQVRTFEGKVLWAHDKADVAIVQLATTTDNLAPVSFGQLASEMTYDAVGFPRFMLRNAPDGATVFRDSYHASGKCSPLTGRRTGTLGLTVEPPDKDPDRQHSPWEGMSGAAVFAGGVLVGVISEHHPGGGDNHLTARMVEQWARVEPALLALLPEELDFPTPDRLVRVEPGRSWSLNGDCPYPGMRPFTVEESEFFFGRDATVGEVIMRLDAQTTSCTGPLVLVAPSGAGKSSLLQAGVLAKIRAGTIPGSADWKCAVFTPTRDPLAELADQLAAALAVSAERGRQALAEGSEACVALVSQILQDGENQATRGGRLLIVVDQLEELFSESTDADRTDFLHILNCLATTPNRQDGGPVALVIFGLRADFYAQCAEYPVLLKALNHNHIVMGAMTRAALKEVVLRPAQKAGLKLDEALVKQLLTDLGVKPGQDGGYDPGRLPLLAYVLRRIWILDHGTGTLTTDGYDRSGGLDQAVALKADEVFASLSDQEQRIAPSVFVNLVVVTRSGALTRRTVGREKLLEYFEAGAERQAAANVLAGFVEGRLLLVGDQEMVQVTHDVLLYAWPTLNQWIETDRRDNATRQEIEDASELWQAKNRANGILYRKRALDDAMNAVRKPGHTAISPAAREFLKASMQLRHRERAWIKAAAASLLALAVAAVAGFFIARGQTAAARSKAAEADAQHTIALSRQLAAQAISEKATNVRVARQLALAAWSESPTEQAGAAMAAALSDQEQRSMLIGDEYPAHSIAFSPSGSLLATVDGITLRFWDPATGLQSGLPIKALADAVAFDPSGETVATMSADVGLRMWNATDRRALDPPLTAPQDAGTSSNTPPTLAYNPAGTVLATSTGGDTVRLWDPHSLRQTAVLEAAPGSQVTALAFSPSGAFLATAGRDGKVRLWDPATGRPIGGPITATAAGPYGVSGIAFNPDGATLATADGDGTAKLWDPVSGHQIGRTISVTPREDVSAVAFSRDGTVLATATLLGDVLFWDPGTGQLTGTPIVADGNAVSALAYNPAGTVLATGGWDKAIRLWNPTNGQPVGAPLLAADYGEQGSAVAYNPTGTVVAAASGNGVVREWDPATGRLLAQFRATRPAPVNDGVSALAYNPAGTALATADDDGTLCLWDPETGRQIGSTMAEPHIYGENASYGVRALAFSPDGSKLVSGDEDGIVRLWDATTGHQLGPPIVGTPFLDALSNSVITQVAFLRGGELVVAGSLGSIRYWNAITHQEISMPSPPAQPGVVPVRFAISPAGTVAAAAFSDETVRQWDLATGRAVGASFSYRTGRFAAILTGLTFSPDGTLLVTSIGTTIRLWDPATGREAGVPIPVDPAGKIEMIAFNPEGTVLASVENGGYVRRWPLAPWRDPYGTLCQQVGPIDLTTWRLNYAPAEPLPKMCV